MRVTVLVEFKVPVVVDGIPEALSVSRIREIAAEASQKLVYAFARDVHREPLDVGDGRTAKVTDIGGHGPIVTGNLSIQA